MPHTRWTLAVTALVLWFAVTSCAYQRQTSWQDETQQALSTEPPGQTGRTILGGKESDRGNRRAMKVPPRTNPCWWWGRAFKYMTSIPDALSGTPVKSPRIITSRSN